MEKKQELQMIWSFGVRENILKAYVKTTSKIYFCSYFGVRKVATLEMKYSSPFWFYSLVIEKQNKESVYIWEFPAKLSKESHKYKTEGIFREITKILDWRGNI